MEATNLENKALMWNIVVGGEQTLSHSLKKTFKNLQTLWDSEI
jgi:hypothetical protein